VEIGKLLSVFPLPFPFPPVPLLLCKLNTVINRDLIKARKFTAQGRLDAADDLNKIEAT